MIATLQAAADSVANNGSDAVPNIWTLLYSIFGAVVGYGGHWLQSKSQKK